MSQFSYCPEILFEETNVVGNVYFANYARWQNECYHEWLRAADFGLFKSVFHGDRRVFVSELSMTFLDAVGATIGDSVRASMTLATEANRQTADFDIRRIEPRQFAASGAPLATGRLHLAIINASEAGPVCSSRECISGIAYLLEIPVHLDFCRNDLHLDMLSLVRLQGKCRERFLADHAPSAIEAVAKRDLALHTSTLSLQLLDDLKLGSADTIQVEMRLTELRGWGRLTVRFDYFVTTESDELQARRHFATGSQSLCCKRRDVNELVPAVFPCELLMAVRRFTDSPEIVGKIDEHIAFQHNPKLMAGLEKTDDKPVEGGAMLWASMNSITDN